MKKIKALILLPFLLLCLCFSNCYYYKTIEQSNADSESIRELSAEKSIVFMQNSYSNALYRVHYFTITDSTFSGIASFTTGIHSNDKKTFLRSKTKEAESEIYPLQTVHIVLSSDSMIQEGMFELPLSEIKSLQVHDHSKGASAGSTVGLIGIGVGLTIAMVGIIFAITGIRPFP